MILDAALSNCVMMPTASPKDCLEQSIHEIGKVPTQTGSPDLPRISVPPKHGFAKALNFTQIHLPISMAGPGFHGLIRVPVIVRTKNAGQNAEGLWILDGAVMHL